MLRPPRFSGYLYEDDRKFFLRPFTCGYWLLTFIIVFLCQLNLLILCQTERSYLFWTKPQREPAATRSLLIRSSAWQSRICPPNGATFKLPATAHWLATKNLWCCLKARCAARFPRS